MAENALHLWMADATSSDGESEWQAILDRVITGDVAAFEQLMLQTQSRVLMTARRMLGNEADAEEAAQEVFLRVYKYLHRFNRVQRFEPWLYRITVNVCNDIGSARFRSRETPLEESAEPAGVRMDPYKRSS